MDEFIRILAEERTNCSIEIISNFKGPAAYLPSLDKVIVNNDYINYPRPAYDQYQLIVVLFHEIGHHIYFQNANSSIVGKSQMLEFQVQNEFEAMKYSIARCLDLSINNHNSIPLVRCIEKLSFRILYGDHKDYIEALKLLR